MTKLLELRERLREFYGKFEFYIKPGIRFVAALITFFMINGNIGYMSRLSNPAVAIALALVCTFLPVNATVVLAAVLILAHLFALSLEACVVGLLLILLMLFMYYKFAPKEGSSLLLTPLLCRLGIGEVMPTGMGLYKEPYSILSMLCGLVIYYFLRGIKANEALLAAVDEEAEVSKFTVVLEQVMKNRELYVTVLAFGLTALVIYVIRRQSFARSWTVAVAVGNALNLLVLLAGSFLIGHTENILRIILGTLAAAAVGLLMEFFLFNLDYARTERLQFEDDEYYYYVKAVPKVFVSGREKRVKQINSRRNDRISKKDLADEFDIDRELLDD